MSEISETYYIVRGKDSGVFFAYGVERDGTEAKLGTIIGVTVALILWCLFLDED